MTTTTIDCSANNITKKIRFRHAARRYGARIGWQTRVLIAAPLLFSAILLVSWSTTHKNDEFIVEKQQQKQQQSSKLQIQQPFEQQKYNQPLHIKQQNDEKQQKLILRIARNVRNLTTTKPYELKHILFYDIECKK